MINSNISSSLHTITIRGCLTELSKLVPESEAYLAHLTESEKSTLQTMISELLKRLNSNKKNFTSLQRRKLKDICSLAKKADHMHLLSAGGKASFHGILWSIKQIGLSLYVAPRDVKFETSDGLVQVNSDALKENSPFFKEMVEDVKEIDTPVDLPEKAVDFLMECLHAPETSPLKLPKDKGLIPGLLRFAAGYGFDKLLQKLEYGITLCLQNDADVLQDDAEDWLSVIHVVKQTHPEIGEKWLCLSTARILGGRGIPVKKSGIAGHYEVSIGHLNAFFKQPTCDLFKYLPLVIKINNQKELDQFLLTIQTTKIAEPLRINLLCNMLPLSEGAKTSLQEVAKAWNINLNIESVIPLETVIFGKEQWDTYFGEVEDLPLPEGILELLETEFIVKGSRGELYESGKKWKDKFMLFLLPKTVDGELLTLSRFRKLVEHPKGEGCAVNYDDNDDYASIWEENGNKAVERSMWALMSMDVINESDRLSCLQQEALIKTIPGCDIPDLLSAHVGILTYFIHTGVKLYGRDGWGFTVCKETTLHNQNRWRIGIGGFSEAGLHVDIFRQDVPATGVGALRKFSS